MNKALDERFRRLESGTRKILDSISSLSDEEYCRSPAEGKWSVAEIISHLMTSEAMALAYMKKKIQGAEHLGNTGLKEEMIFIALQLSQRLPLKFRAPGVVKDKTPLPGPRSDATLKWRNGRKDLYTFLQSVPEHFVRKKIFRHPVAGLLDAKHAVGFMYEHLNHHMPQITAILKKIGK